MQIVHTCPQSWMQEINYNSVPSLQIGIVTSVFCWLLFHFHSYFWPAPVALEIFESSEFFPCNYM